MQKRSLLLQASLLDGSPVRVQRGGPMRKSSYLRYRRFLKLIEMFLRMILALLELIQRLV